MKKVCIIVIITLFIVGSFGCENPKDHDASYSKAYESLESTLSADTENTTSAIKKTLEKGDTTYNALYSILGGKSKINSVTEYIKPAGTPFIGVNVSVEHDNAKALVDSCYLLFGLFLNDSLPDYDAFHIDINGVVSITLQSVTERWCSIITIFDEEDPVSQVIEAAYNIKFKETDFILRNK